MSPVTFNNLHWYWHWTHPHVSLRLVNAIALVYLVSCPYFIAFTVIVVFTCTLPRVSVSLILFTMDALHFHLSFSHLQPIGNFNYSHEQRNQQTFMCDWHFSRHMVPFATYDTIRLHWMRLHLSCHATHYISIYTKTLLPLSLSASQR